MNVGFATTCINSTVSEIAYQSHIDGRSDFQTPVYYIGQNVLGPLLNTISKVLSLNFFSLPIAEAAEVDSCQEIVRCLKRQVRDKSEEIIFLEDIINDRIQPLSENALLQIRTELRYLRRKRNLLLQRLKTERKLCNV